MSETTVPVARSPIAPTVPTVRDGWVIDARHPAGPLTISDETPLAKVHVRGPFAGATREALGVGFGRTTRTDLGTGEVLVVGSGPGEWLALGAPTTAGALRAAIDQRLAATGEFVTVLDLTHGRALVRLTGRDAPGVLAGVCAVDLSDTVTPNGSAFRTAVAAVVTDVVRDDDQGVRSYLLHCDRSSGRYLFDALLDAGRLHGLEVTGLRGLG